MIDSRSGKVHDGRMDLRPTTARERILAATIDLIEREGPRRATTRAIAARAEVNVAAINYYYRSKEALIEAALASSWEHALGHLRAFLAAEPWDPRTALGAFAEFLLEGGYRFREVTRATIFDAEGKERPSVAASVANLSRELAARLDGVPDGEPDADTVASVGAFVSALIFPPLAPACVPWMDDPETRRRYAATLADALAARAVVGRTSVPEAASGRARIR